MTTKTTGAELKRFYNDDAYWPEADRTWHDGELITINGIEQEHIDINEVPDEAVVTVHGGAVFSKAWDDENAPSYEGHFKKWRKAQAFTFLTVEVPKEKLEDVRAALRALGVKA